MKAMVLGIGMGLALTMAGCGSSSSPAAPTMTTTGTSTTVTIPVGARTLGTSAFAPNPVTISAGSTISWVNSDSISHTSTSDTNGLWDSLTITPGGHFEHTFTARGTFTYHCTFHPGMIGTVTVQ